VPNYGRGSKEYFTFVKGLNTEASPLTFPENTSLDEENFELLVDGSRRRRLGIDYESSYTLQSLTVASTDAITVHNWTSVAGNADTNFIIYQVGSRIYRSNNSAPFSGTFEYLLDLTNYKSDTGTSDATVAATKVSIASGRGRLMIVGRYTEPVMVTYDPALTSFTIRQVNLMERDLAGVDDSLENDATPTALSDAHKYNLFNQGWLWSEINTYQTSKSKYPSNAMVPWKGQILNPTTNVGEFNVNHLATQYFGNSRATKGKIITSVWNQNGIYTDTGESVTNQATIQSFTYNHGTTKITVTTSAAHGYANGNTITITGTNVAWDALVNGELVEMTGDYDGTYTISGVTASTFDVNHTFLRFNSWIEQYVDGMYGTTSKQAAANNIVTRPTDQSRDTDERPQAVAWYTGRVWYAGINERTLSSRIYFSQIVTEDDKAGLCYQSNDPTSQHVNVLVDNDGGFLEMPEINKVLAMTRLGDVLVLLCSNGVWLLGGTETGVFRPTGYTIQRLSNVGIVGADAYTIAEDKLVYAAKEGIFVVSFDPEIRSYVTGSISERSIQTLYDAIPIAHKPYMAMVYDDINKRIQLLYSNTGSNKWKYDYILMMDMRLQAFFKYKIPATNPYVAGAIPMIGYDTDNNKIRYLTVVTGTNKLTWSVFRNDGATAASAFKDWYIYDSTGIDAAAYLLTGYEYAGKAHAKKWAPLIYVYCKRTETAFTGVSPNITLTYPSSCYMQARWNWSDHANSGKFSDAKQVYRFRREYAPGASGDPFDNGEPVVVTRNKVRGCGKTLHLKFYTESGKDTHLLGWATVLDIDQSEGGG
jgi:hypothetical protein